MLPLLARTMALVVLGVLLGYTQNELRADGVSIRTYEAPASCGGNVEVPHPIGTVTPSELLALVATEASVAGQSRSVLVLDGRSAREYEQGHVAGAIHLPCAAGSRDAEQVTALASSAGRVLVYAASETDARTLALELAHRLAPRVTVDVVAEGFDAIGRTGVPQASGPCEGCLSGEGP